VYRSRASPNIARATRAQGYFAGESATLLDRLIADPRTGERPAPLCAAFACPRSYGSQRRRSASSPSLYP
jgi:hypothetical protein